MKIWCDFGAVVLREEGDHFLDLHDLLSRTAQKAEEGFAKRLTWDAEAGECGDAFGDVWVAAPWKGVCECSEIIIET